MLVGKLLGMAIRMQETTRFSLSRNVRKYLLGQPIEWYDMAFFDYVIFETFSKLMVMYDQNDEDSINSLDLHFECFLSPSEGKGYIELVPGGSSLPVTLSNVKEYIHLYCEMKMITLVEPALYHIKKGLEMFVPTELMNEFSSEDLHQILCGHQTLRPVQIWRLIEFKDESHLSHQIISEFQSWFKSVVYGMDA